MKLRNKILLYFSTTLIGVFSVSLYIVFVLFSAFREEEFQQQQFSKIKQTIGLIDEFSDISEKVSLLLDKQDIHDFYDEKLLIYDNHKKLIFSSIDNLNINQSETILNQLSVSNNWIETKENDYDLIGAYVESNGKGYYGISKAYDIYGYSKKDFLKKVLILIFVSITVIVILISIYLSRIISKPISELTRKIDFYDLSEIKNERLKIQTTTTELRNLTDKFNELINRTNNAFLFQKHSINHISHELKTPISVLVSELEKLQSQTDIAQLKNELRQQTQKAKSLGNIINILLQISKVEAGQEISKELIRIDDLIFDSISEVNLLYPNFNFEIVFLDDELDEKSLGVFANRSLLKQAILNLLQNAAQYSNSNKAKIAFRKEVKNLVVSISNSGKTLSTEEQKFLFSHFFRGENSQKQSGFGLGLVLSQKIFEIHQIAIQYNSDTPNQNVFELKLPQV